MRSNAGGYYYFDLNKLEGLTIEGNGSTLRLHPHAGIMLIQECRNVTFRGFVIEHDPLPFTQGTIRDVDVEHGELTLAIDDGYSVPPAQTLGADTPRRSFASAKRFSRPPLLGRGDGSRGTASTLGHKRLLSHRCFDAG